MRVDNFWIAQLAFKFCWDIYKWNLFTVAVQKGIKYRRSTLKECKVRASVCVCVGGCVKHLAQCSICFGSCRIQRNGTYYQVVIPGEQMLLQWLITGQCAALPTDKQGLSQQESRYESRTAEQLWLYSGETSSDEPSDKTTRDKEPLTADLQIRSYFTNCA